MSKHFQVVLDELQCFLELLGFKVKLLKVCVNERKENLQSRKGEGQVKVEANSHYCEIQVSLLDQTSVVQIGSYVNQLY
jgi:hypothetical protein